MYRHVLARLAMCFLDDIVKVGILLTITITSTILHSHNVDTKNKLNLSHCDMICMRIVLQKSINLHVEDNA